jgi:hypothetical protein
MCGMRMVVCLDKGDLSLGFVATWLFMAVFDCGRE